MLQNVKNAPINGMVKDQKFIKRKELIVRVLESIAAAKEILDRSQAQGFVITAYP